VTVVSTWSVGTSISYATLMDVASIICGVQSDTLPPRTAATVSDVASISDAAGGGGGLLCSVTAEAATAGVPGFELDDEGDACQARTPTAVKKTAASSRLAPEPDPPTWLGGMPMRCSRVSP
jgi:hypothetical protein